MLTAAGDGEYDPSLYEEKIRDPNDVWQGTYHEDGAHLYDEWDHQRLHYRKNWCVLREVDVKPGDPIYVGEVIEKHLGLVKHLRRTFEAMRDENRLEKRQPQGDDVDIDALIEALADSTDGREMSDRLFQQIHRSDRSMAVMFMVDMSGSTKGWINDAERESLIMLCESLETLGDRYAIYGFSGTTRKRCEIFRIKQFDEPYNLDVKARIAGIAPQEYTRMGAAIRHLSKLLNEVEAKTKLLITLSDGKPDDYFDIYRGQYGIEDTRQALFEARRSGIHPFCITIDKEGKDYLPHMYGHVNWVEIDDVKKLPLRVADIYRRLTT
jgi:nitric oxide reductase NorD protein